MAATRIDGKQIAEQMQSALAGRVQAFAEKYGFVPGLSVILVGDDPASEVYVRNKHRACAKVGIRSETTRMPAETTEAELLAEIDRQNADPTVQGILVQLPLPAHLRQDRILARIAPEKDVDGLTRQNVGSLFSGGQGLVSCTPKGILELIRRTGVPLAGKHAVVIGRSNLVGKPVAMLLLQEDATVTMCHSKTENLPALAASADILIAAVGKPGFVTGDFIKEGAVVIDVGTSRVEGKLRGDVDFAAAMEKAAYVTPVPGGVGPMTITMLLENTLEAAQMQQEAAR